MNKTLLASALLITAASAHAVDAPQWNQLSLSGVSADIDTENLTGLAVAGSKELGESIFFDGRLELTNTILDVNGTDVTFSLSRFNLGLGYRHHATESTDLYGIVAYERYGLTASVPVSGATLTATESISGLSFTAGVRSMTTENIELEGAVSHIRMLNDDDTVTTDNSLTLAAMYHINDKYSIGLRRTSMDDADFTELKGTMSF